MKTKNLKSMRGPSITSDCQRALSHDLGGGGVHDVIAAPIFLEPVPTLGADNVPVLLAVLPECILACLGQAVLSLRTGQGEVPVAVTVAAPGIRAEGANEHRLLLQQHSYACREFVQAKANFWTKRTYHLVTVGHWQRTVEDIKHARQRVLSVMFTTQA